MKNEWKLPLQHEGGIATLKASFETGETFEHNVAERKCGRQKETRLPRQDVIHDASEQKHPECDVLLSWTPHWKQGQGSSCTLGRPARGTERNPTSGH